MPRQMVDAMNGDFFVEWMLALYCGISVSNLGCSNRGCNFIIMNPTGHTPLLRRLINVIDVDSTLLQRRVTSGSVAR